MILLEDDLLRPLPIGLVNLKSYLPQTGLFLQPWYFMQCIQCILIRGGLGEYSIPIKARGGGGGG